MPNRIKPFKQLANMIVGMCAVWAMAGVARAQDAPAPAGSVLHLPLAGDATDHSAQHFSVEVHGNPTFGLDATRHWMNFDGINDYLLVRHSRTDSLAFDPDTNSYSYSFWANIEPGQLDFYFLQERWGANTSATISMGQHAASNSIQAGIVWYPVNGAHAGVQASVGSADLLVGNWHHFASVYVSSPNNINVGWQTLYIDGVARSTAARLPNPFTPPDPGLVVGAGQNNSVGNLFKGKLSDLRVYNRALTDRDVRQLASAFNVTTPPDDPFRCSPIPPIVLPQPGSNRPNLLLIAHGWNGASGSLATHPWVTELEELASQDLTAAGHREEWDIVPYRWVPCASDLLWGPGRAMQNASLIGSYLGAEIQARQYQHVHVVAHSAGAWMLPGILSQLDDSTSAHATFLDAYVPLDNLLPDSYASHPSRYFFEQYYSSTRLGCILLCGGPSFQLPTLLTDALTHRRLPLSYNVDVSSAAPCECGWGANHGYPYAWYISSLGLSSMCGGESIGYGISKERLGASWDAATLRSQHPSNDICVLSEADEPLPLGLRSDQNLVFDGSGVRSSTGQVAINGDRIALGATNEPAWVNIPVSVANRVNRISANITFQSAGAATGELVAYWNGEPIGSALEAVQGEWQVRSMTYLFDEATAGDHILSFRLDAGPASPPSQVLVSEISTGWHGEAAAPAIIAEPRSGTVARGDVMLTTTCVGIEPLTYQWRRNFVPIDAGENASALSATLVMLHAGSGQSAWYDCVVSNAYGTALTTPMNLFVCGADYNADQFVDFFDYLDFVSAFVSGDAWADFNEDSSLDFFDYLDFVDAYSGGCP